MNFSQSDKSSLPCGGVLKFLSPLVGDGGVDRKDSRCSIDLLYRADLAESTSSFLFIFCNFSNGCLRMREQTNNKYLLNLQKFLPFTRFNVVLLIFFTFCATATEKCLSIKRIAQTQKEKRAGSGF